ncbi:ABC transporter ATP-binding protein [Planctomycetota bacterium]|nr:ABC transporter ATP-binding protein [Planctomycetota bacterium]
MTDHPRLAVAGLTKRFGAIQALAGVDLHVGRDELVVVLGATGAGKTTLLRTIAGLETPDAGSVAFDGAEATSWNPAARDVALMFQDFALYPDWTVRRNLEFPLRAPARRLPESEITQRIAWVAELLAIGHLLDKPSTRLSGGQMQRVALGRALVRRPRLFLLDEPLTNLDAKLRERLRLEIAALRRELHTPMLYVTHDQGEALAMADRIVVLIAGRVAQVGSAEDIYDRPASPEVARLLGHPPINLIAATASDGFWRAGDGTPLAPATATVGSRATIGIRPEHLAPNGGPRPAQIRVVQHHGAYQVATVAWAGGESHVLLPPEAALPIGTELHPSVVQDRALIWPG